MQIVLCFGFYCQKLVMTEDQQHKRSNMSPLHESSKNFQNSQFRKIHRNVFETLFPGKKMTQVQTRRDSTSLLDSSIFETSNAEKLVQFIRQKRGLRNAQRIFCNTTNKDEHERSFPIEIEPSQEKGNKDEPKKSGANCSGQKESENQNEKTNSPTRPGSKIPKVSLKRLSVGSGNLVKRVLTKEFEKIVDQQHPFQPIASSTPNNIHAPNNPDISGISAISPNREVVVLPHLRTTEATSRSRNVRNNTKEQVIRKEGLISHTSTTRKENPFPEIAQEIRRNSELRGNNFEKSIKEEDTLIGNCAEEVPDIANQPPHGKSKQGGENVICVDERNDIVEEIKEEVVLPETPAERIVDLLTPDSQTQISISDVNRDKANQSEEIRGNDAENTFPRPVIIHREPSQVNGNNNECNAPVEDCDNQNIPQLSPISLRNQELLRPEANENDVQPLGNLSHKLVSNSNRKEFQSSSNRSNQSNRLSKSRSEPISPKRCLIALRRISQQERIEKTSSGLLSPNRVNRSIAVNERGEANSILPSSPRNETRRERSNRCEVLIRTETPQYNVTETEQEIQPTVSNTVQQIRKDFGEQTIVVIPINQTFKKTSDERNHNDKILPCNKCTCTNTTVINPTENQKEIQPKTNSKTNKKQPSEGINDDIMTSDEEENIMRYSVSEDDDETVRNTSPEKNGDNIGTSILPEPRNRTKTQIHKSDVRRGSIRNNTNEPIDLRVRRNSKRNGRNLRTVHPSDELIDEIMQPLGRDILNPQPDPEPHIVNEDPNTIKISDSSSSSDETLGAFNDNLTDWHPNTRNEIVHDIPVSSVSAWTSQMRKLSQNTDHKKATKTRGRRVITNVDALKKAYLDISKNASSTRFKESNSSRRKLYSKGQSDEDDNEIASLSQQDGFNCTETPTTIPHVKNAAKKTLNFSGKSRRARKGAQIENFPSLSNSVNDWNNKNSECFEKNSSNIVNLRNDDEIFKKPIQPPLKSTITKSKNISEAGVKSKNSLRRSRINIRRISSDSSSSSSRDNSPNSVSENISTSLRIHERVEKITSNISISTINNQDNNNADVHVPVEPELSNKDNRQISELEDVDIVSKPKRRPFPKKKNAKLSIIPENERPRRNSTEEKSKAEAPIQHLNDNEEENNKKRKYKKRNKRKGVEMKNYLENKGDNEEENNKKRKYKKQKKRKGVEMKNNLENEGENALPTKKSKNAASKSKDVKDSEANYSDIRRSSRQRRAPIAYWLNNGRNITAVNVAYKDLYFTKSPKKKTQKQKKDGATSSENVKAKTARSENDGNKKAISNVPTSAENVIAGPSTDLPVSRDLICQEESQVANELFDRLKESFCDDGTRKQKNPSKSSNSNNNPSALPQIHQSSRPPFEQATSSNDEGISTSEENQQPQWYPPAHRAQITIDSGNVTGSTSGAQQDGLLAWLKNFLTTRTVTKNPEIVQMIESNNFKIANVEDLVCTEIDGVEYAYYVGEDNNYGYMKFHPHSVKRRSRAKKFDLKFLILCGTLQLVIENSTHVIKNGDFLTVHKGNLYKLTNNSPNPALLFFIKN